MATIIKNDQQLYSGRGPLDAKSLVKTYDDLTKSSTWTKTIDGVSTFVAYNYMIVSVWLDKEDATRNGVYYLYDPSVDSVLDKPDPTNPNNWHKLNASDDSDVLAELEALRKEIADAGYVTKDDLDESKVIRIKTVAELPNVGDSTYFYTCDDGNTYVYADGIYTKFAAREIKVLDGGTAADFI